MLRIIIKSVPIPLTIIIMLVIDTGVDLGYVHGQGAGEYLFSIKFFKVKLN